METTKMSQNPLVNTNKDTSNEVEVVKKDLDSKKVADSKKATADSGSPKKATADSSVAKKAAVDSSVAKKDTADSSVAKKDTADSSVDKKKTAVDSSVDKKKTAVDSSVDKKKTAAVDSKKTAADSATKKDVDSTDVAKKDADGTDVGKKKTETDGYKKIQLMMNTAKNETIEEVQKGLKKDLEEFKNSIMSDLQEIKNSITRLSSNKSSSSNENGSTLSNTADLVSKLNDLDTKLNSSNEKQEFNFNWLKIALDGVLHKNDIDLDVKPVIKGEVKAVKKAPAKAKTTADSASAVDLSTIKSTNFLKHQVLNDSEYILQLFNNREYGEHITNSICEHIKALPIAASFNKDADVSEKVEFFTNYVRSNESASTKLFTLLNKNTAFKKTITSNFESWKSQNTVNVNKDFLGEEDA